MGTMSDTTKWVRMYQSPKLEFVVNQDIWYNSETRMADVILPACTNFERDDIGEWAAVNGYTWHASSGCNYRVVVREQKCIEPLWESKSDYEIFALIFEKMGLRDQYTDGGKTEVDWVKKFFDICDLPKVISWEEFNRKGYHIININDDYKPTPGLRWFYEGRPCDTPDPGNPKRLDRAARRAGHLQRQDRVRVGEPQAVLPRRRRAAGGAAVHPQLGGVPHPRALRQVPAAAPLAAPAVHVPLPLRQAHRLAQRHPDAHRIKKDGHAWWPARINPEDAAERGINNHDIVRLYNDRASVLCIAVVTGRIRPGVIHSYASSALYDPLQPGEADSMDRGGCVAMLTPSRMLSKNVPGMTPNSCLIEIERWEG